ncbi:methyl-accepting chemotaxis protein [Rhodoferax saidenbachensis]|uniref:methyl-accepting chemotaxis protein n=1 Tax=Rhodoferax saidenbachensis TaxID=1484693 RepID=UPI00286BCBBF|nr:methyl-accepting chemotaxis protein [Rhodoferax saidenbachensis]
MDSLSTHSALALEDSNDQEQATRKRPKRAMLENLSVRASLWLAFASVLAGAVVIGVFSLFQMGRLNASTKAIYEQEYAAGQAAEQARGLILRASRAQTQLLTATTAAERNTLGTDIEASLTQIGLRLETIKGLSTTEESSASSQQLIDAMASWTKRQRAYIALVKEQPVDLMQMSPDVPTEDARLLNDTRKLEKIVDLLVEQRSKSAEATIVHAGQIYQSSQTWVVGIMVLLFVLSLAISGWVTRRLVRQLGGEPAYAKSIASRIAQGDLSMHIAVDPKDTESLLYSLRDMQGKLADTMREIASSSKQVANASREISMGNLDLSQRTEQQSASLEKTTTNVEQMAAIAKRHADSATHAAQLSGVATRSAQQGGDVVASVVSTMEQISKSTQAIHGNISVIEGIAFQTNILALNAAVEAAHAGEQGRGFAVVAAEVRSLAERSAKAAREINALIEASSSQVKDGAELAQRAGQTIREMAQTVAQVSTVMEEISGASVQQSSGIEEINRAVAQLDDSTQQNAALVEQAAAAAQSLDEQAQSLDQLVGRFALQGEVALPLLR